MTQGRKSAFDANLL